MVKKRRAGCTRLGNAAVSTVARSAFVELLLTRCCATVQAKIEEVSYGRKRHRPREEMQKLRDDMNKAKAEFEEIFSEKWVDPPPKRKIKNIFKAAESSSLRLFNAAKTQVKAGSDISQGVLFGSEALERNKQDAVLEEWLAAEEAARAGTIAGFR